MIETAQYINRWVYPGAMALLPEKLDVKEARAEILAIGFQETGFKARLQMGGGPAHSFWQMEEGGGVAGVLSHPSTKPLIEAVLPVLVVKPWQCYEHMSSNDVLACVFARLLLWSYPAPLPRRTDPAGAWQYYLMTWRPGKPHPETWLANHKRAWEMVDAELSRSAG